MANQTIIDMKDALLESAYRRLLELEKLLLPDVPETVWPAEVAMVLSEVEKAGELPAHHQRRLQAPYQPHVADKNGASSGTYPLCINIDLYKGIVYWLLSSRNVSHGSSGHIQQP